MAAQIWFLRHGEAEPHGTREDSARRLTDRGEAQSRAAGIALHTLGVDIAHVFTSPKVRAHETARLACVAGVSGEPVAHEALVGLDERGARELAAIGGPHERILLVGHEPDFSQVVHDLTGARTDVKKGCVIGVRLLPGGGELIVLLRPRELAAIAGVPLA